MTFWSALHTMQYCIIRVKHYLKKVQKLCRYVSRWMYFFHFLFLLLLLWRQQCLFRKGTYVIYVPPLRLLVYIFSNAHYVVCDKFNILYDSTFPIVRRVVHPVYTHTQIHIKNTLSYMYRDTCRYSTLCMVPFQGRHRTWKHGGQQIIRHNAVKFTPGFMHDVPTRFFLIHNMCEYLSWVHL